MWKQDGTLWVYTGPRWVAGRPLAMFDFDSTLHPYRGKGPDTGLSCGLLAVLTNLAGRNVVIFSNRSKKDFGALRALRDFVALLEAAGGSCDVYAATARDRNRKPQQGAWERFLRDRGVALTPFLRGASFFCGDAAGRASDFSASDRGFAVNAGVRFCVPEQIFGAHNVAKGVEAGTLLGPAPPLDPRWSIEAELAAAAAPERAAAAARVLEEAAGYDMVLMVGSSASGKSRFARRLGGIGFKVASQDVQGTKARCKAFLAAQLSQAGTQVVVDNTHRSGVVRAEYIAAARAARPGLRVAIVWVTTPQAVCLHLDGLRCDSDPSGGTPLLPRPVIPSFWKNFEPPDGEWQGPPADETPGAYPSWVWEQADALLVLDFAWDPAASPGALGKRYA
jgi:bifunctional polynucleotide phosphatase/kinase